MDGNFECPCVTLVAQNPCMLHELVYTEVKENKNIALALLETFSTGMRK